MRTRLRLPLRSPLRSSRPVVATTVAALALAAVALSGCTASTEAPGGTQPVGRISLLLVRTSNIRYLAHDQPHFTERMLQLCPRCTVDVQFAEQDAKKQAEQVKDALDHGTRVLVLNAVDPANAGPLVTMARERKVPVIAYDRLVSGAPLDYYVSFDNYNAGKLQGQALLDAVRARGDGELLWVDGPASDVNAGAFAAGAHEILDGKVTVAAGFHPPGPGWTVGQVRTWLRATLPTMRSRKIIGVYSPIDPVSAGVVAELQAAGISPLPAVTGQDSDVAGLQRVMAGQQLMTLYKPFRLEATKAAEVAFDLLRGRKPAADTTVDNKAGAVPSYLLQPVPVTRDTIKATVLKDGFVSTAALCAGDYADDCRALGVG